MYVVVTYTERKYSQDVKLPDKGFFYRYINGFSIEHGS